MTFTCDDKEFQIPDFGTWNFFQDFDMISVLAKLPLIGGLISGKVSEGDLIESLQNSGLLDEALLILFVPVGERYSAKRATQYKEKYLPLLKEEITNDAFAEAIGIFFQSAKKSKLADFLSRLTRKTATATTESTTGITP